MSASLSGRSPFQFRIASLTKVHHQHPEVNGSTTEATSVPSSSASYKDFLPASRQNQNDQVEPVTDKLAFLKQEFGLERLNRIHEWLWLVGRPMPPRPLHYQKAVQRDIILHEQLDLHLVRTNQRLFLKPIPRYLFWPSFWHDNLSCKEPQRCAFNQHGKEDNNNVETIIEDPACETCEIYRCALGFILSYASLISYESDLRIAKEAKLVPEALDWPDWRKLVEELLTPTNKRKVNKRYVYGELRLAHFNKICRYTLNSPIRGFYYGYNSYHQFWDDNHTRIVALFAYIALVLTAMQVGLATKYLQPNNVFQRASYGFTVFSIIFPSACIGLALGILVLLSLYNALATLNYHRRKKPVAASSAQC